MIINVRWLLSTTALTLVPIAAVAADRPSRGASPPPPTIAYDWTGLYTGVQIGGNNSAQNTRHRLWQRVQPLAASMLVTTGK